MCILCVPTWKFVKKTFIRRFLAKRCKLTSKITSKMTQKTRLYGDFSQKWESRFSPKYVKKTFIWGFLAKMCPKLRLKWQKTTFCLGIFEESGKYLKIDENSTRIQRWNGQKVTFLWALAFVNMSKIPPGTWYMY